MPLTYVLLLSTSRTTLFTKQITIELYVMSPAQTISKYQNCRTNHWTNDPGATLKNQICWVMAFGVQHWPWNLNPPFSSKEYLREPLSGDDSVSVSLPCSFEMNEKIRRVKTFNCTSPLIKRWHKLGFAQEKVGNNTRHTFSFLSFSSIWRNKSS